jgi:hypothetical protein
LTGKCAGFGGIRMPIAVWLWLHTSIHSSWVPVWTRQVRTDTSQNLWCSKGRNCLRHTIIHARLCELVLNQNWARESWPQIYCIHEPVHEARNLSFAFQRALLAFLKRLTWHHDSRGCPEPSQEPRRIPSTINVFGSSWRGGRLTR